MHFYQWEFLNETERHQWHSPWRSCPRADGGRGLRSTRSIGRVEEWAEATGCFGRRTPSGAMRPRWPSGGPSSNSARRPQPGAKSGVPGGGILVLAAQRPHGRTCPGRPGRRPGAGNAGGPAGRADLLLSLTGGGFSVPFAGRLMRGAPRRAPARGLLAHLDARSVPGPSSLVRVRRYRHRGRPPPLLTAAHFAILNSRSISTGPPPVFAAAVARPVSTGRAAASATMASVLP